MDKLCAEVDLLKFLKAIETSQWLKKGEASIPAFFTDSRKILLSKNIIQPFFVLVLENGFGEKESV